MWLAIRIGETLFLSLATWSLQSKLHLHCKGCARTARILSRYQLKKMAAVRFAKTMRNLHNIKWKGKGN
jgi:hypothetical protein